MSKLAKLSLAGTLPFLLLMGCAHQQSESAATATLPPTSSSSAQRVYGTAIVTAPGGAEASVTRTNSDAGSAAGAAGASQEWDVAEKVQKMIFADRNLLPYPSKVTATMHPTEKGAVVLTGTVPNGRVKRKLVERVAAVSGVTRVEDKVEIALTEKPGEDDIREIVPQP